MKKTIAGVLAILLVMAMGITCCAQTVDSKYWGITFNLSDDWKPLYDDSELIHYEHMSTAGEHFAIEYSQEHNVGPVNVREIQDIIDETIDEELSNSTLAAELSESNDNVFVSVTENYLNRRYETYNGIEYYRAEKLYLAKALGYENQYFYETMLFTVQNSNLYCVIYECRGDTAPHFGDVTEALNSMSYANGEIKININGQRIYPDSAPFILSGRTLVPIRAIAEAMGYKVEWDGENQLVLLESVDESNVICLGIGIQTMLVNDVEIELDVPPVIINGRTYLPLRAVTEAMDAQVGWDGETKTVDITKKINEAVALSNGLCCLSYRN